jgi:hypothetical protein
MQTTSLTRFAQNIWIYVALGLMIGGYCFFHPIADLALIITPEHQGGGYWYRIFSETIFKPQTIYLAESILLPLIAKILGANSTVFNYQVLCAFITVLMMPAICIVIKKKIHSIFGVVVAIFLWTISYVYLQSYELGFPDPLTIILLVLILCSTGKFIFIFAFLSALSHFSTALLALLGVLVLSLATKNNKNRSYKTEIYIISGLLFGKIFLIVWGYLFHYHLNSRINFVFEQGFGYFWERYLENPSAFWYMPGKIFIVLNIIIFNYFFLNKKLIICLAQCLVLAISYFSLFITVDGLRIFAIVIAPGYLYLIIIFINDIFRVSK